MKAKLLINPARIYPSVAEREGNIVVVDIDTLDEAGGLLRMDNDGLYQWLWFKRKEFELSSADVKS